MRQKLAKTALRLLGPALLLVVVLRLPDGGGILRALRGADLLPLLAAFLLNPVNLECKILRWEALLKERGVRSTQRKLWGIYLASSYVGMLTPGRVGDALRAHYLYHDDHVPYAEGMASVVMDRLCDLYVLVGFVAVGIARFSAVMSGKLALVAWSGVAATALVPLVFLVPGVVDGFARLVSRRLLRGQGEASFALFLEALRAHIGRGLLVTVPLTVVAFGVNYLQGWLMARSLHLGMTLFDATCLLAVASLLGLLPISVSGLGVREFFFSLAFPALGFVAESGVTFGLLVFAVLNLSLIGAGFIAWQLVPPPTGGDTRAPSLAGPPAG